MIVRDLWALSHPDAPHAVSRGTKAMVHEWRDRDPLRRPAETYVIEPLEYCACCGAMGPICERLGSNGTARCAKHAGRNPCAIEGCTRTTAQPSTGQLSDDDWLCSVHWKAFVPPRSPMRRAYHRFFRLSKKRGWDDQLERRFWRYWRGLVSRARRGVEGDIDEAEIARLFGWDPATPIAPPPGEG